MSVDRPATLANRALRAAPGPDQVTGQDSSGDRNPGTLEGAMPPTANTALPTTQLDYFNRGVGKEHRLCTRICNDPNT